MAPRALLLATLLLAGCGPGNPVTGDVIDRPGTWQPTGENDANLRAMIADPRDLIAGAGSADSRATAAAPPVERLVAGKRAPLSTQTAADIGGVPPQGGSNAGGQ